MSTPIQDDVQTVSQRLHRLVADWQVLQARLPTGSVAPSPTVEGVSGLQRETIMIDNGAALEQLLARWVGKGAEGWIEATGAVHEIDPNSPWTAPEGRVLSADLAATDGAGLRVRTAPDRRWTATEFRVTQVPGAQTPAVLVHEVRHASARSAAERLVFRVASTLDDAGNLQVVDAWFTGFAMHKG